MIINTNLLVSMTEANQNFSKVVRMVDKDGLVVILKSNRPRYAVVPFSEYDAFLEWRKERSQLIDEAADRILEKNAEAFRELAK